MTTEITPYIDVAARMAELGCEYPSSGIVSLPVNFEDAPSASELLQASETWTVKKLLRQAEVPVDEILERGQRPIYIKNKSAEWAALIIFFSAAFYSQNLSAVSVALSVIANYATDFLRGMGRGTNAKLDIIVETRGKMTFKMISYEGPPEQIRNLGEVVRRASGD